MKYLKRFGVSNFKAFNNCTDFEFAPITILTGKNNSGKSSLIKALLLISKSVNNYYGSLNFDLPELKLGSPHEILNLNSKSESIQFTFSIDNEMFPNSTLSVVYEKIDDSFITTLFSIENKEKLIMFYNDFKAKKDPLIKENLLMVDFEYFINQFKEIVKNNPEIDDLNLAKKIKIEKDYFSYSSGQTTKLKKSIEHNRLICIKNPPWNEPDYKWPKELENCLGFSFDEKYDKEIKMDDEDFEKVQNQFISLYKDGVWVSSNRAVSIFDAFSSSIDSCLKETISEIFSNDEILKLKYKQQVFDFHVINPSLHPFVDFIDNCVMNTYKDFLGHFRHVSYFPSIRARNERLYVVSREGYAIQEFDQKTFESINFKNDIINQFYLDALKDFEIGEKIEVRTYQRTATEIQIIRNGEKMLLSDLGFGYAQLLPIILKILVVASSTFLWEEKTVEGDFFSYSKILIEEPESNLHPDFQAKLADLFVKASNLFCIQFIIETHSEYLIRRLQYLTARKDIKPDDISIYYFNNPNNIPEGEKQINKIEIRPDGILKQDFGSGFYDQAANSTYDLFRLIGTN